MKDKETILRASKLMARNYNEAGILIYGEKLNIPNKQEVIELIENFRKLYFPAYFGDKKLVTLSAEKYANLLIDKIYDKLLKQVTLALPDNNEKKAEEICLKLIEKLPEIQEKINKDLIANFEGDPAAESKMEVLFSYPGFYAIFVYRIAHELYKLKVPTLPRIMTEYAHSETGIDINPGANIGDYFFIDHGTGVVVGETATIGNHVKMYQGATLGALSPAEGQVLRGVHRHPTVGDNVTLYANATVLGGNTIIGNNSILGGNTFITHSIEENTQVSNKSINQAIKK